MTVDPQVVTSMSPAFKEAKLTQDQVNTVAAAFMQFQKGMPERLLARDLEVTMKDPEIGGLNWGRTQGFVNQALGAFTDVGFRKFLQQAGIANRLEFVRVFERIGRAMSGDVPARGAPDAVGETTRAQRIYGRGKASN
jgi:hypothetical protein